MGRLSLPEGAKELHDQFADIDLGTSYYNEATDEVAFKRLKPEASYSSHIGYDTVGEAIKAEEGPWGSMSSQQVSDEALILRCLEPLSICKAPTKSIEKLEASMYYSCQRCNEPHTTGNLITAVHDNRGTLLPIFKKDMKALLEGSLSKPQIT